MGISDEVREAYKRGFSDFLYKDGGKGICKYEISALINNQRSRLIVNISNLHCFRDLAIC